ncbi:uncharacterized protein LOC116198873 [Punica granatum]|uniref:Uncharacterized protein LOC116198873 n=1 Tax=Punica granatum TaxID=22663 RepID=A0A6P8CLA4_PUNGR|nr:uncharacterized protein LOC116198873 [Punica granatum]
MLLLLQPILLPHAHLEVEAKTELPTSIPPSALVPASASALSKHPRDEGEASRAPVRKKKSSGAQLIGFCYLPRDRSSCEDVSRFSKEELVDIYLHEELRNLQQQYDAYEGWLLARKEARESFS